MQDNKVKVLYIGGSGRSGSTLLERILGQLENFVAIGELRHIWDNSFVDNQLCSCGKRFAECEFWVAVVRDVFGNVVMDKQISEIRQLKSSVDRVRYIPRMLWMKQNYVLENEGKKYAQILVELYRSIRKISGNEIIIDASKDASTAYLLNTIDEIDLHIVHLVRDPRAVAFSWQRKKVFRPEMSGAKSFMATHNLSYSTVDWVARNMLIHILKRKNSKYKLLKYEELVQNPRAVMTDIQDFMNVCHTNYSFIQDGKVHLNIDHTVAGNPFRFKHGEVALRFDSEWLSQMQSSSKYYITILSLPLLYQYGYPLTISQLSKTAKPDHII